MKGSVDVIRELMKFNKQMVTSCHNKTSESTPLHMAAEGGHPEVVRVLIEAGASPTEETRVSREEGSVSRSPTEETRANKGLE